MTDLTLFHIESELADLVNLRDQLAEQGEDLAPIDTAIREYVAREIRKVDGIRAYLKHAEMMASAAREEAKLQKARGDAWQARIDRLKDFLRFVMEDMSWTEGKPRRIEGKTGSLVLKPDGGRQAVEITDASLIPEEYVQYTGTISGEAWETLHISVADERRGQDWDDWVKRADVRMERIPHKGRIGEALAGKCCDCRGSGRAYDIGFPDASPCRECSGDGLARVPGARLVPRGSHVEVR